MDRIDRIPYQLKPQILRCLEREDLAIRGWHFIGSDLKLRFSQETLELGKIYEATGGISLCNNGMHACRFILDALKYASGPVVCQVKVFGDTQEDQDKFCGRYRQVLAYGDIGWQLHQFGFELACGVLGADETVLCDLLEVKRKWIERRASSGSLADARQEAKSLLRHKDSIQARMVAAVLEEDRVWTYLHQIARAAYGQRLFVIGAEHIHPKVRWQTMNNRFETLIAPKLRYFNGSQGYTNDYFQNDPVSAAGKCPLPTLDTKQVEHYAKRLEIDSENIRASQICTNIKRLAYDILMIAPPSVLSSSSILSAYPYCNITRVSLPSELAKLILHKDFDFVLFDLGNTNLSVEVVYQLIERVRPETRFNFAVFGDVNEISRNIDFVKHLPKVLPKPLPQNFYEKLAPKRH